MILSLYQVVFPCWSFSYSFILLLLARVIQVFLERGEEKGQVDHQATQVLLEYLVYLETEGILVYQELQVK